MTRIRLLAAAGMLCLVGGFFVAGPASAAVAPPAHSAVATDGGAATQAHSQVAVMSNKTCPVQFGRFRIYNPKCGLTQRPSLCFIGNHGNFRAVPRYASNGCKFRVWMYTAENEVGHALCISPHTPTNGLKKNYRSFRVVRNQDRCT
jgi:hypothetical protein